MNHADPVAIEIFRNLFVSVAEEMGVTLQRTAYSPNIKERRDFSCACFLADGQMIAQAAHIPVHLGAMPASVRAALQAFNSWSPGDLLVLNDPYLGGTHLPDITMVSPAFVKGHSDAEFFVATRAHHSDVGGMSPGSMGLATEIYQEGLIIPPLKLMEGGKMVRAAQDLILRNVRTPEERRGDLAAQMAAHRVGEQRLEEIVSRYGLSETLAYARALLAYAERMTRSAIRRIPAGVYIFRDEMDDDGTLGLWARCAPSAAPDASGERGSDPTGHSAGFPAIQVAITVEADSMTVDYSGSSAAVAGPLNAVRAITESATWYVALCLARVLGDCDARHEGVAADALVNSGSFAPIRVVVPRGSLLDAEPPHAVAAGNVETSQRIVDVLLGALAQALPGLIPAASQGTMNNLSVGGRDEDRGLAFAYYETVGGGAGAGPAGSGLSGVHVHMTNTLNTPVEALEFAYPLRVLRYGVRRGSGGAGQHTGGDGLIREIECLSPATVTILSDRRRSVPYGLCGGQPGQCGRNSIRISGNEQELPGKVQIHVGPGTIVSLCTPGGGGWGRQG